MHRYILSLAAAHFLFIMAGAQIVIKGKVVDALSNQPLEAATVADENASRTITDQFGNFYLKTSIRSFITVSYIGYKTSILHGQ